MRVKTCYICKMELTQASGGAKGVWLDHMGKKENQKEAEKAKQACGEEGAFEVSVAGNGLWG